MTFMRQLWRAVRERSWVRRSPAEDERVQELLGRGHRLHGEGDLAAAEAMYRKALALAPHHAPAHYLLGGLLGQTGRLDPARAALEAAVRLDPAYAPAWVDLGHVRRLQGNPDEACAAYRRAVAVAPSYALAAVSLGELLLEQGDAEGAAAAFEPALETPADARAVKGIVKALERLGRAADARRRCEAVLAREPDHAEAHASFGYLLLKREYDPRAALHHLEAAAALRPNDAEVHANRGIALHDLARFDAALAAYETALAIDPEFAIARFHRSLALLIQGEFGLAWPDYELRLISEDTVRRSFPFPRWQGEDLTGKTLLVTAEQGIGDEIMFASCLPDVIGRAGHVIVECSEKLAPIYGRSFPAATVRGGSQLEDTEWVKTLGNVDCTCPVGSLPLYLRPSRASFPRHSGYLRAHPALCQEYQERLAALGPGLKVGLSWRGGTDKTRRALRSLTLEELLPVLSTPGVQFVDLQYDDASAEIETLRARHGRIVHHWRDALVDYDRTAALVSALDLVLSVCTAVIHLGGALGKPVWVMAPFVPEWRYGAHGEDMAWYPSVRILRQSEPKRWEPVIRRVCAELASLSRTTPKEASLSS